MRQILFIISTLILFSCHKTSNNNTSGGGTSTSNTVTADSVKITMDAWYACNRDCTFFSFNMPQDNQILTYGLSGYTKLAHKEWRGKVRKSNPIHMYQFNLQGLCDSTNGGGLTIPDSFQLKIYVNNVIKTSAAGKSDGIAPVIAFLNY